MAGSAGHYDVFLPASLRYAALDESTASFYPILYLSCDESTLNIHDAKITEGAQGSGVVGPDIIE